MLRGLLIACLALGLTACSSASDPVVQAPGIGADQPELLPPSADQFDPIDDLFREGAGVIDGDVTLNGSTETDPNYDTSPYIMTQPAKAGDIAIFRVKGKLSNSATTTLYTKQSSPSKNYSSFSVPGTFVDQYKAMYVTGTEPLSITFYNASNYNAPINSKAAIYDYNFKTQAAENPGEPNDDDNAATITDRTLATNLPLNFVASRSVYKYDDSVRDIEEWYKASFSAGDEFSFKFTTVPSRFGKWSYVLKVLNPDGVQMGGQVAIPDTASSGSITRTATTTGTYYLQMVGTPIAKNNTNLFYNLYTITACRFPAILSIVTPQANADCPGRQFTFSAATTNSPTAFSWNFGGGATPNTSTSATPTVTLGANGQYDGTLTVSNDCGSDVLPFSFTVSCAGGVGQMGGAASFVEAVDMVVDPDGVTHLLGSFDGSVDLDPGPGSLKPESVDLAMYIVKLDHRGYLIDDPELLGGTTAGNWIRATALAYDPVFGYRVTGEYNGTIDFWSGAAQYNRISTIHGSTFILATRGSEGFQWMGTCDGDLADQRIAINHSTGDVYWATTYTGAVDIDPGISTFAPAVAGGRDCALIELNSSGQLLNAVSWGGTGQDIVSTLVHQGAACVIGGRFDGLTDLRPGAGVVNSTSPGIFSGFLLQLDTSFDLLYTRSKTYHPTTVSTYCQVNDVAVAADGGIRVVGEFTGTTDLNPGQSGFLTSLGAVDGWLLQLDPNWNVVVGGGIGGTSNDTATSVAVDPGTTQVLVLGTFQGTVDFDRTAGVDQRTAVSLEDVFLSRYDTDGNRLVTSTWGGNGADIGATLGVDNNGTTRVAGSFANSNADFDPGPAVFNLTELGDGDVFLQRLLPNGLW